MGGESRKYEGWGEEGKKNGTCDLVLLDIFVRKKNMDIGKCDCLPRWNVLLGISRHYEEMEVVNIAISGYRTNFLGHLRW